MTQPALLVSPQLSEASPTYELAAIRQWLKSNRCARQGAGGVGRSRVCMCMCVCGGERAGAGHLTLA